MSQTTEAVGWRVLPYQGDSLTKRCRIQHTWLIEKMLAHLRRREYVVLLGPPFSEKTRLLGDLNDTLKQIPTFRVVSVNLRQARSDDESTFFSSLAQLITRSLFAASGDSTPSDAAHKVDDARAFQNFLIAILALSDAHIVLLIDHLQVLPYDLVHGLLQSLRVVRMEQDPHLSWQLHVVVAGGVDLANLAQGATSPFNIAYPVLVPPLSEAQSLRLADETLAAYGKVVSENALERIWHWAGGDYYLIPYLCSLSQEAIEGYSRAIVTTTVIDRAAERIWADDRACWSLREAVQLIEEDADTLLDVLEILARDSLPRNQTRQPITRTGTNRLELCGAFVIDRNGVYHIKNEIFRRHLLNHFTPMRVGHVLRMKGRWSEAIEHLAPRLLNDPQHAGRPDLLEAIIQSIYAADDLDHAYAGLVQGIRLGFGHSDVYVYRADVARNELHLVHPHSPPQPCTIELNDDSRVEVRTFRNNSEYALRGADGQDKRLVVALVPEKRPIGVVTVQNYQVASDIRGIDPELSELLRFLRHAAGAVENVMLRSAFQQIGRAVLNVSAVQSTLERVLHTVSGALGCDAAALYLLEPPMPHLQLAAYVGPSERASMVSRIELTSNHPAVDILTQGPADRDARRFVPYADEARRYLVLFLRLEADGNQLGILELDFDRSRLPTFNEDYNNWLYTFADQVAIAVYNLQLLRQTDNALKSRVLELEAARRDLARLSDQDLTNVARSLLHRIINAIGDVPYQLSRARSHLTEPAPVVLDALEHVEKRVRSLSDLRRPMEDLVNLARISFERIDLNTVVQEATQRVIPYPNVNATLDLPQTPVWIEGSEALLCDALQSVIENGCEAMPHGGELRISLRVESAQTARVEIHDTGVGVPVDLHERIYEPGFSSKEATEGGRGRGLFTSRVILRKHDGKISHTSSPGQGATFVIELPLFAA